MCHSYVRSLFSKCVKTLVEEVEVSRYVLLVAERCGQWVAIVVNCYVEWLGVGSELASLSSDNQRQYLSLIESGEQSPTVRALLAWKKGRRKEKEEKREEEPEDRFDEHPNFPDEDISFEPVEPSDDIEEKSDASGEPQPERANHVEQSVQDVKDKRVVCDIADIPNRISDPQSEAKSWLVSQQINYLSKLKSYADAQAARDDDELISSQWKVRSSVLSVQILLLKG